MKKKLGLVVFVLLAAAVASQANVDGDPPPDCPPIIHCIAR